MRIVVLGAGHVGRAIVDALYEEHEMTVRNIDRFFGEISTIEELRGIWSGRNA